MKIQILTIGKLSLNAVGLLAEEYVKRITRYLPVKVTSLKSSAGFAAKLGSQDSLVVLDERGKTFSSMEFAGWLEKRQLQSLKNLVFLVGPAEGVAEEIKSQANLLLSLSPMTLQHELALVVLLEQIYRACTILKGEPYHK